jgi:hypothetical protein
MIAAISGGRWLIFAAEVYWAIALLILWSAYRRKPPDITIKRKPYDWENDDKD